MIANARKRLAALEAGQGQGDAVHPDNVIIYDPANREAGEKALQEFHEKYPGRVALFIPDNGRGLQHK